MMMIYIIQFLNKYCCLNKAYGFKIDIKKFGTNLFIYTTTSTFLNK